MCPPAPDDFSTVTLAHETDEVPVCLVEINHASLTEPIRLSSDRTTFYKIDEESGEPVYVTHHNGNMYVTAAFSFIPPGLPADGTLPKAKFVVAAEQRVRQALREVHEGVSFKATLVYASDPDTIIAETPELWLDNVNYSGQIEAELTIKHFLNNKCPSLQFLPSVTPGLFKSTASGE